MKEFVAVVCVCLASLSVGVAIGASLLFWLTLPTDAAIVVCALVSGVVFATTAAGIAACD